MANESVAPPTGWVVWITGLPSSGKSTLAVHLFEKLRSLGQTSCILDGDSVRAALTPCPGYSETERKHFYETLARLAALLSHQGLIVLVPATAHRREFRQRARALAPQFIEVWVRVPVEECRSRDSKGLYAAQTGGEPLLLPGVSVDFEPPETPFVIANGGFDTSALDQLLAKLAPKQ